MKLNEEEERAINTLKQLSDFDDLCENCYYEGTEQKKKHGCWGCRENAKDIVLSLIEKLQKENEEFKKRYFTLLRKYEELKYDYAVFTQMSNEIIDNSILKQKIKDKIEEINKAYEDSKDENGESVYYYPDYTINILEELLESE